ncbi:TetR/AcrR family transcriptional regulator [Streptomyces spongiae]|uniref:TetR/AcrR family transcriptional regulator n=1 Tax=Streptomyces spongiae TaxID=565072 RepID=A0A5N8XNP8_9ACTN|nr:TetR/AcrR family transcriptional regulator [Streptomyces spongiae]MPY60937.1 TetR/AcrR family transcriptional regulator [Streptomyces spongiae]
MPRIRAASVAEHRDQTMTRLLDAFEAALEEEGFAEITLAGVAERAGIARNTVYNYAKDKQALLVAAVRRAMLAVLADLDAQTDVAVSAEEQLLAVIDRLLADFSGGAPRLLVLQALQGSLLAGPGEAEVPRLDSRIEDIVRRGIETGEFRPSSDVALTVAMMAGAAEAAVRALSRGDRSLAHITREVKTVLLRAVRA